MLVPIDEILNFEGQTFNENGCKNQAKCSWTLCDKVQGKLKLAHINVKKCHFTLVKQPYS